MRKLAILALVVALVMFGRSAGRLLVVQELRHADAILVLEGEADRRPALGLDLLRRGYATRLILDVASAARIYERPATELARQYLQSWPPELASASSVCVITAQSTKAETRDARRCLDAAGARSVLLVTSDYHTRRALSIFRHELPEWQFGVAGATDPGEFGVRWWQRRQWAKRTFDEWVRLTWWELVDRW